MSESGGLEEKRVYDNTVCSLQDGKVLLSSNGTVLDFCGNFERMTGVPSIEIYGKSISTFVKFKGFETRAVELIYGDVRRFKMRIEQGAVTAPIVRSGWIIAKSGSLIPTRIQTSALIFDADVCINLELFTLEVTVDLDLIPEGLNPKLSPVLKLFLGLWKHDRPLFSIGLTFSCVILLGVFFIKGFLPYHLSKQEPASCKPVDSIACKPLKKAP